MSCVAGCLRETGHASPVGCVTAGMTPDAVAEAWHYQPVYGTGVRAWWHHVGARRLIGPDLTLRTLLLGGRPGSRRKAWRAVLHRARPSARLRQCDVERDYWKRVAHKEPRGDGYGHTL